MEDQPRKPLTMSRALLTALGLDRLLMQQLRRRSKEQEHPVQPAQRVMQGFTPRRERRRTGITARQQRVRRQRGRDKMQARRYLRLTTPIQWPERPHRHNRADRRFLAAYGRKAEAAR
jgi:hypothetical protein